MVYLITYNHCYLKALKQLLYYVCYLSLLKVISILFHILAVAVSFNLPRSLLTFSFCDICMLLMSSFSMILLEVTRQLASFITSIQSLVNQEGSNIIFI